jgi:hypothetical protein
MRAGQNGHEQPAIYGDLLNMMLVYDGNCPLCVQAVQTLSTLGFLEGIQPQPWQSLSTCDATLAERIKTEFLLIEPNNNQVQGGFEALAYLMGKRFSWTKGLLSMPSVMTIGIILYKIVSMNRRVLAPSGNIPCDCDPPFHLGWRAALWVLLLLISVVVSTVFGFSAATTQPDKPYFETVLQWMLVTGSGWILNILIFGIVLPKRHWDFVQQCLVVMAFGSFWLIPFALINLLGSLVSVSSHFLLKLRFIGIVLNHLIILYFLSRRLRRLKFPKWAPWLWFVLFQSAHIPLFIYLTGSLI